MDSPDPKPPITTITNNNNNNNSKLINHSSSDSPSKGSPIFNFISNLSPLQPVKAAPVAQGFPGLASPPLVFASPRINSRTSFINRQLSSSASNLEFSQENYKSQKNDGDPGDSEKLDLELQSPLIRSDKKDCNTEKLAQVAHSGPSGCFDKFLINPMESANSSLNLQPEDGPQSSKGGCSEKKDDVNEHTDLDGSRSLNVTKSAHAKVQTSVKVEPEHVISPSSERSVILAKLSIGHTSELCHTGNSFSEAVHLERGTLRRCLFDENRRNNSTDGSRSWNPNDNLSGSQELTNMPSTGTPGNRQMINLSKPMTGMYVSPVTGNCPVPVSKPLGIGLHLNSVVYPRAVDTATGSQQSYEKVVRVKGKNSVFVTSNRSAGKHNTGSISSNSIAKVSASSEETHQNMAYSIPTSGKVLSSDVVEHFNDPILSKPDDPPVILNDKRKLAESTEELNPASPKKKRKKASETTDDDTSKRCNCKKTKCLKLYCDCFAAGFYCGESCSCQGCFNRPEYEDTVLETRQQIESRNPLAFAPKVVQLATDSPASSMELENLSTPSSARHKRGCNCKKSMCLKKYCECYQANVGCSDGCRCEGCKNIYGKREDYNIAREIMLKKAASMMSEGVSDEKQETVSSNFMNSRAHNSPSVTPLTPALQCSDQRKNALKSRLPFTRYLQSPDSHHDMLPSNETLPTSSRNSQSHTMVLENSGNSHENTEKILLSACDEPINASSTVSSSSSKTRVLGSSLPPSGGSLRWRSSPMPQSIHAEYCQNLVLDSKYSDMVEDDTPEILKNLSTPPKSVKVSSPNKKRISPPHSHTGSPESLKSSRKFVLRAVPSFPPLTPYSRSNKNDDRSESFGR